VKNILNLRLSSTAPAVEVSEVANQKLFSVNVHLLAAPLDFESVVALIVRAVIQLQPALIINYDAPEGYAVFDRYFKSIKATSKLGIVLNSLDSYPKVAQATLDPVLMAQRVLPHLDWVLSPSRETLDSLSEKFGLASESLRELKTT
jgi:hypothetical protein